MTDLDLTENGDSIYEAFVKTKTRLNHMRKLNYGETEPEGIVEGEYWLRTTDNTLMRKGATTSTEANINIENQYAILMSIIFN